MSKGYAELILESLLKEDANQADALDAIKKRYEVTINYKDEGYRQIEPCAYGKSPKGNLVIRAYQTMGFSHTSVTGWKEFNLCDITEWKPNKTRKFKMPKGFNTEGDKGMSEVYIIAKFNGIKNDALLKYNQRRHAQKVAENPYYDLQRNIKNSYNANQIDYIKKNIADWQKSDAAKEFHKGNGQSIYDMSRITNFGDKNDVQTVGPVRKGNVETAQTDSANGLNYNMAINNGPLYKQNIQQQEINPDEYENSENQQDTDQEDIEKQEELNGRR